MQDHDHNITMPGRLGAFPANKRFTSAEGSARIALEHITELTPYLTAVKPSADSGIVSAMLEVAATSLKSGHNPAQWMESVWGAGANPQGDVRIEQLPPLHDALLLEMEEDLFATLATAVNPETTARFQSKLIHWMRVLPQADLLAGPRPLMDQLEAAHERYLLVRDPPASDTAAARTAAATNARRTAQAAVYNSTTFGHRRAGTQFLPPAHADALTTLAAIRAEIDTTTARVLPRWRRTRAFLDLGQRSLRQRPQLPFLNPQAYFLATFRNEFGRPGHAERAELFACKPKQNEQFLEWLPRFRELVHITSSDPKITQEALIAQLLTTLNTTHLRWLYSQATVFSSALPHPRLLDTLIDQISEHCSQTEQSMQELAAINPSWSAPPLPRSHSPDPRHRSSTPTRTSHTSHPRASSPPPSRRSDTPPRTSSKSVSWGASNATTSPARTSSLTRRDGSPTTYINPRDTCPTCQVLHPQGICPAHSAGSSRLDPAWQPTTDAEHEAYTRDCVEKGRFKDLRPLAEPRRHSLSRQQPSPSGRTIPYHPSTSRSIPSAISNHSRAPTVVSTTSSDRRQQSSGPRYNAVPPHLSLQSHSAHYLSHRDDPDPCCVDKNPSPFSALATLGGGGPPPSSTNPLRRSTRSRSPARTATTPPSSPPPAAAARVASSSPGRQRASSPAGRPIPFNFSALPPGTDPSALDTPGQPRRVVRRQSGGLAAPSQLAPGVFLTDRVGARVPGTADVPLQDILEWLALGLREGRGDAEGTDLLQFLGAGSAFTIGGIGVERYVVPMPRVCVRMPVALLSAWSDAAHAASQSVRGAGGEAAVPAGEAAVPAGEAAVHVSAATSAQWDRQGAVSPASTDSCGYDSEGNELPYPGYAAGHRWSRPASEHLPEPEPAVQYEAEVVAMLQTMGYGPEPHQVAVPEPAAAEPPAMRPYWPPAQLDAIRRSHAEAHADGRVRPDGPRSGSSSPRPTAMYAQQRPQLRRTPSAPLTQRTFDPPSIAILPAHQPNLGITVYVEGKRGKHSNPAALCDSGANVNLVPERRARELGLTWEADDQIALCSTAPGPSPTLGKVTSQVSIVLADGTDAAVSFDLPLHVIATEHTQGWDLLLGTGWLAAVGASIDFFESRLHFRPRLRKVPSDQPVSPHHKDLRVYSVPLITTTKHPSPAFLKDLLSVP